MNIYLDIDGTMLHENLAEPKAAVGLEAFIVALRPYDTYWLTTHCRDGNPERPREIMKRFLPLELHGDIDRIKPTVWDVMRTEGIDWSQDFIWFDDTITETEWKRFETAGSNQQVIEIDLRNNPNHLMEVIGDILS